MSVMELSRAHTLKICLLLWTAAPMLAMAGVSQPLRDSVIYPWQSASAITISRNESTLSARIEAQVNDLPAQVSQQVTAGELLVELDCADYHLAVEAARAQLHADSARLTLAQDEYQRTLQLRRKDLVAQSQQDSGNADVQVNQAGVEQARVALAKAELQAGRCQVLAPFDGVVTQRLAAKGQWAVIGTPLLTVVETTEPELSAKIAPDDIPLLEQSQELYFDFGRQLPVVIRRVGSVVDPQTRNADVRLAFPGEAPLPGVAGKLIWRDPRPFIPSTLIVNRNGQLGIFSQQGLKAQFIPLDGALPARDYPTELPLDTQIITQGLGSLQSGDALAGEDTGGGEDTGVGQDTVAGQ